MRTYHVKLTPKDIWKLKLEFPFKYVITLKKFLSVEFFVVNQQRKFDKSDNQLFLFILEITAVYECGRGYSFRILIFGTTKLMCQTQNYYLVKH